MLDSKVEAVRPKIQSNYEEENIWRRLVLNHILNRERQNLLNKLFISIQQLGTGYNICLLAKEQCYESIHLYLHC